MQQAVHRGESGPRRRVLRVQRNGAFVEFNRVDERLVAPGVHALAAAQEQLVGLDAGRQAMHRAAFARVERAAAQQCRHFLGDLVLHGEHIGRRALEFLRPLVIAAGDVDELHRDAQSPAGLAHAAFEQAADAEFASHFAQVVCAVELERRAARGHAQPLDVRQGVDQFLGETLAEEILVARLAHVDKGQYGNRRWNLRWTSQMPGRIAAATSATGAAKR